METKKTGVPKMANKPAPPQKKEMKINEVGFKELLQAYMDYRLTTKGEFEIYANIKPPDLDKIFKEAVKIKEGKLTDGNND